MTEPQNPDAAALIAVIRKAFSQNSAPVTVKQLSDVYGVLAAQHEATLRILLYAMSVDQTSESSDRMHAAIDAVNFSSVTFGEALKALGDGGSKQDDKYE